MTDSNRPSSLRVDRFMRMPTRTGEVWQGAGVLLPIFAADEETGEPVRQAAIAWSNTATGDVMLVSATPAEAADPASITEALLDFGSKNRKVREGRPSRIEVRDEAVGLFIKTAIGDPDLEVAVVTAMPRIDDEVEGLILAECRDAAVPGVLGAPGVTVERLRAFADAVADFCRRQLWHELGPEDLVMLESPTAPEGMGGFVAEYGGGQPTVSFYSGREEFERLSGGGADDVTPVEDDAEGDDEDWAEEDVLDAGGSSDENETPGWLVEFVRLHELPARDVAAWADMGLPVAAPDAYPVVIRREEDEFARPDAGRLAFLEGLFRALAATTEDQIDSGRWHHTVATADGPATYRFALTTVLDEPAEGEPGRDVLEQSGARLARFLEEGDFETIEEAVAELEQSDGSHLAYPTPENDDERAQYLVYASTMASGRRRLQLLRQAVAISPNCFPAFIYLAENATRPGDALELFERGRAAAHRAIGLDRLAELKGRYWGDRQTRLYLRLRLGLALALRSLGRREAAAAELQEAIELDQEDRAGIRDYLLALLLVLGRDERAWDLVDRFEGGGPAWVYGLTLLAFRHGDRRLASQLLAQAYLESPACGKMLVARTLGADRLPETDPDAESNGHEESDEAEECLDLLEEPWLRTPGALEWMATQLAPCRDRRRRGRTRGRRGRR